MSLGPGMEVAVRCTADRWDRAVPPTVVATAHLVMIAVDEQGKPRPIPPLELTTDEERHAFHLAEIRRKHRLPLRDELAAAAAG